ncbi:MAG: cysteine desulfurase-like protein [Oscillochloridaceae bacterium]|nr:cysteine desulfurase-like protein [Chloroflexaceae bacterium]MDW8391780.1 cysteine desulfurase-like protein [Oscillochloridaceae bacterium]
MLLFDPYAVRPLFPALAQQCGMREAVFFDGPGGTQVPQSVIEAMASYLATSNANTHGAFPTSRRTDETIAAAHRAVADLLGCASEEIVFGPNMTTLTFAVSRALGRDLLPGDEVVVTRLDHDANVAPWRALEERGAIIREVDVHLEDCTLNMADLAAKVHGRTRIVAVNYASNAVGTISDVQSVIRLAHSVGAIVYVDAVHYAPHGPIDVRALGCDFLACSVYKFFGPHVGVLYGRRELLERLQPYKVRPAPEQSPERWMTGTQNHEGLAGTIAAIEYLASLGVATNASASHARRDALMRAMTTIKTYERGLAGQLVEGLLRIPGLTFYGIREAARFDERTPTAAFRLANLPPRAVAEALAERGIFVWDGNFYAVGLTERLGVEDQGGLVRVGLTHYNTPEEVDYFLDVLDSLAAAR